MSDLPVAIVTGAGSGIGRAVARALAGEGHRVILAGRHIGSLEETGASLAAPWYAVTTDVSQPADVQNMIDAALSRFGRLDVLLNNAGIAPLLAIDETTPSEVERVFRVNAMGVANAIARAWPIFKRQKAGCVVNISTLGTQDPFPGFLAYAASKASVESMVKSCAKEGRDFGVRAFAVAPGAVETETLRAIFPKSAIPPGTTMQPERVAEVVIDCVLGKRDDMNGQTIYVTE